MGIRSDVTSADRAAREQDDARVYARLASTFESKRTGSNRRKRSATCESLRMVGVFGWNINILWRDLLSTVLLFSMPAHWPKTVTST